MGLTGALLIGVAALFAGFFVGQSFAHTSAATPRVVTGALTYSNHVMQAFQVCGSGRGCPNPSQLYYLAGANALEWQDSQGLWHLNSPVACLNNANGQKITFGVVDINNSSNGAPGREVVTWVQCPS